MINNITIKPGITLDTINSKILHFLNFYFSGVLDRQWFKNEFIFNNV